MNQFNVFQKELEKEAVVTRKMLALIPNEKYDWQPHPKSMTIRALSTHIAELPTWVGIALNTTGIDFATMDYKPTEINDTPALMQLFENSLSDAVTQLTNAKLKDETANGNEAILDEPWTMRSGDTVYGTDPKADVIRMSISQIIHHRAQLGVFLRLLDIPIPGSYGPSADESF